MPRHRLSAERRREIAARLRFLRGEMLQSEMGERLGVAGNAVSLWEHGGRLTLDHLIALQDVFGYSLDWLLSGDESDIGRIWFEVTQLPPSEQDDLQRMFALLLEQAEARTK
jgi:transcriptional regulator with XRE-family HTH domain